MTLISTISAIRYGYGLGSSVGPRSGEAILTRLAQGDRINALYPVVSTENAVAEAMKFRKVRKAAQAGGDGSQTAQRRAREDLQKVAALGLVHGVARILDTDDAFRERLVWFWADHFTAVAKNPAMNAAAPAYLDEAIRPHVTGRFADMLKAVVTHPFMLAYLDQISSVGPASQVGKRRGRGLNENLAREVLELHTLGVGGAYGQADVRQLAELMTGLTYSPRNGFTFEARMSEPGAETILGKRYGGEHAHLSDIMDAMDDLAAHPDTARHLARKLAVNLVSDNPDPALVDHMAAAYLATDGDLNAVYTAMLEHRSAWVPLGGKAKKPFDFIVSALLALGLSGRELVDMEVKALRQLLFRPLVTMGQPFMHARGPDGWPEAAEDWITPMGLASRIAWAIGISGHVGDRIAAPSAFLQRTLADAAGPKLTQAVMNADTRADAIALILASAEFNRR